MKNLFFIILIILFFPAIASPKKSETEKQSQAETYFSWWLDKNSCWYKINNEMTNFANNMIEDGKINAFENHQLKFWQDLNMAIKNKFPDYNYSKCPKYSPEEKAIEWAAKNLWFQVNDDMTDYAIQIHGKLTANGIDPIKNSLEYYGEIDRQMRMKFPNYNWK